MVHTTGAIRGRRLVVVLLHSRGYLWPDHAVLTRAEAFYLVYRDGDDGQICSVLQASPRRPGLLPRKGHYCGGGSEDNASRPSRALTSAL